MTGIGIAAEKLEVALSSFGQVDGGLDRRHEGAGLGLTLAQALTQALGGRLSIDSAVGKGTRIRVEFAATAAAHAESRRAAGWLLAAAPMALPGEPPARAISANTS